MDNFRELIWQSCGSKRSAFQLLSLYVPISVQLIISRAGANWSTSWMWQRSWIWRRIQRWIGRWIWIKGVGGKVFNRSFSLSCLSATLPSTLKSSPFTPNKTLNRRKITPHPRTFWSVIVQSILSVWNEKYQCALSLAGAFTLCRSVDTSQKLRRNLIAYCIDLEDFPLEIVKWMMARKTIITILLSAYAKLLTKNIMLLVDQLC